MSGQEDRMDREQLGRLVRAEWVNYCIETGDTKPSHIAPWEDLSDWDKEADRRIGEVVARAVSPAPAGDADLREGER